MNLAVGCSYREAMSGFAQMRALDTWYARLDADEVRREWDAGATKAEKKRLERNLAKARTKDSMKAFDKLTRLVGDEPRIISDPPLIVPIKDLLGPDQAQAFADAIRVNIRSYRRTLPADRRLLLERFRYVDSARKVVGVGSVGTRAWVVLMIGNDGNDPLFLQIKEAEASVLEPFLGKSKFANHGQRVVEGQRLIQTASDILLGWFRSPGIDGVTRDFYIRQLWDGKASALVETMSQRGLTGVRRDLRPDPGASPRPLRGPRRHRRLPRPKGRLRPGAGLVRRDLRRSERTRLRRPPRGRRRGAHHRANGPLDDFRTAGRPPSANDDRDMAGASRFARDVCWAASPSAPRHDRQLRTLLSELRSGRAARGVCAAACP